ncbi:hypothetical protein IV203_016867 [Nitzschia inconspicua]|uniref:Uncharacterized protein n=1 Tax=Nitzschia inconspicua TaxID=303405 RepID=A0A9K3PHS8_9STRA|nr:hypothetical protein IV203_016867 [Nitzschia inconspicua]
MVVITLKKMFTLVLPVSLLSDAQGLVEFGRERFGGENIVGRKRFVAAPGMFDYEKVRPYSRGRTHKLSDQGLKDIIDARSVLELSSSISLSMSMEVMPSVPTAPTFGPPSHIPPSGPPGPAMPSAPTPQSMPSTPVGSPSSNPALLPPPPSNDPEIEPTVSYEPSMTTYPTTTPSTIPSSLLTEDPTVSYEPSVTSSPVADGSGTECVIENGLTLGASSDNSATPIFLAVGYQAESTTSIVEDFRSELENELIGIAVSAILGCEVNFSDSIFPQTLEVATCTPAMNAAEGCFVMETEAIVFIKGLVNEDVAAFEAYQAIQNAMFNGRIVGRVPTILRLQFLSPLPLPVPPGSGEGTSEPIPVSSNRSDSANVNPWTIGASVASIMGGFVSILVWARARKFRQRRQQLMDETSWVNGDSPAAE